eukprot:TRINITY_DN5628_c0_g2_i2.p1 TRINITY_DN5628_c0_g2~~TRINITY_DN5628_c0_g2_i2.p1  ORF type:complete len:417 (+),score=48.49 TRINITY_DN5628_c0_g2_i2:118-1368(+)
MGDWRIDLIITAKVLGWISICVLSVPIATFLFLKRGYPARLPLFYCLSSLGLVVSILIGVYHPSLCWLQAVGIQFFANACVYWWLIISFNFFRVVFHHGCEGFEKYYHISAWGLAAAMTVVAVSGNMMDETPGSNHWECWISKDKNYVNQYLFFYGEMAVSCVIGISLWVKTFIRVIQLHLFNRGHHNATQARILIGYARHLLFIFLFFVNFLVMLIYRITDDLRAEGAGVVLVYMHTIALCGVGFNSFVVFGSSSQNCRLWRDRFTTSFNSVSSRRSSDASDLAPPTAFYNTHSSPHFAPSASFSSSTHETYLTSPVSSTPPTGFYDAHKSSPEPANRTPLLHQSYLSSSYDSVGNHPSNNLPPIVIVIPNGGMYPSLSQSGKYPANAANPPSDRLGTLDFTAPPIQKVEYMDAE